jgi:hypothetical protein
MLQMMVQLKGLSTGLEGQNSVLVEALGVPSSHPEVLWHIHSDAAGNGCSMRSEIEHYCNTIIEPV